MVGNLLLRGILVGVFAGLLAFGFARIFGEPQVNRAIAFEDQMSQAKGEAPEPLVANGHVFVASNQQLTIFDLGGHPFVPCAAAAARPAALNTPKPPHEITGVLEQVDGPVLTLRTRAGTIALGLVLNLFWPASFLPSALAAPLGFLITLGAIGLGISAIREMFAANTPLDVRKPSTEIVTSGVFRKSRNPIYLGMLLATNHGYRSRSQEPFPGVSFERRGAPFVSGLQAS
jgi:hypothetical protein